MREQHKVKHVQNIRKSYIVDKFVQKSFSTYVQTVAGKRKSIANIVRLEHDDGGWSLFEQLLISRDGILRIAADAVGVCVCAPLTRVMMSQQENRTEPEPTCAN